MERYIRIAERTFWTWIVISVLVGLGVGLGVMVWQRSALSAEVTRLTHRLESVSQEASGSVEQARAQLGESEARIAELTDENAKLTADLEAAKEAATAAEEQAAAEPSVTVAARTIAPSTVSTGGSITMTARVNGEADRVTMRITGTGSVKFDAKYELKRVSSSGSIETWKRTIDAPSKPGTYRYYATAYKDGVGATMPGASPSSFKVE